MQRETTTDGEADGIERPIRRWPWAVGGLVIGFVASVVIVDLATPDEALAGASASHLFGVLGTFVVSPGFGGLAAVVAAGVAYRAAAEGRRQTERQALLSRDHDRAQAAADRLNALEDREDDRWWTMYRMVYEDAAGLGQNGVTLALEALDRRAHTDEQDSFLVVLSERLTPTDEATQEGP
ncbi:hypothetical protein [uncultured Pseudokineococcus sp.]|uniref:hypothetical protein n=1 Tax=uncultured Pseudokineococcus sp. TaxID=1642928 RepID=UPI002613B673|nr:hypothetical protein [uncultured Pseudokineococcus sp.]